MELEEFKLAWQELDRKITSVQHTQLAIERQRVVDGARGRLRRFAGLPIFDLLGGVLAAGFLGNFLAEGPHDMRSVVPAVLLFLANMATLAASAAQLALLGRIDYSAPVVMIQRQLGEIRTLRLRYHKWLLILCPLLWPPIWIVATRGLIGFDLLRYPGTALAVWWNVAFGVAFIPVVLWISHRFRDRLARSPIAARLADDIAGRSLAAAIASIAEIDRFAAES